MAIVLNAQQQQALDPTMSLFVEAAAGSGKTAVLVARYVSVLRHHPHWDPADILAITFTKKAATEMLSRIRQLLIDYQQQPLHASWATQRLHRLGSSQIGTIHALCLRILQQFPFEASVSPDVTLLEPEQREFFWQEAVDYVLHQWDHSGHEALFFLLQHRSYAGLKQDLRDFFDKQDILPASELAQSASIPSQVAHHLRGLFEASKKRYDGIKNRHNVLDYGDLIIKTCHLLSHHPWVAQTLRGSIKAIMVDECQDTDPLQWQLIEGLCDVSTNMFLVGDPKQAIYGFRGVRESQFKHLWQTWLQRSLFHDHMTLSDNYRTQAPVLAFINQCFEPLFKTNPGAMTYHPMVAKRQEVTGDVRVVRLSLAADFDQEITAFLTWFHQLPATCRVGVLARNKRSLPLVQAACHAQGIACSVSDTTKQMKDVRWELFEWCQAVGMPDRNESVFAVLISPFIGLSLERVWQWHVDCCKTQDPQAITWHTQLHQLPEAELLRTWIEQAKCRPLSDVLEEALWHTQALSVYTHQQDVAVVDSFLAKLRHLEKNPFLPLDTVMALLRLFVEQAKEEVAAPMSDARVQLMTIHAAKGLEFDAVCLIECGKTFNHGQSSRLFISQQGVEVSYRVDGQQHNDKRQDAIDAQIELDIAEEKRIFYVACTRARDHLLLVGRTDADRQDTDTQPRCYMDWLKDLKNLYV